MPRPLKYCKYFHLTKTNNFQNPFGIKRLDAENFSFSPIPLPTGKEIEIIEYSCFTKETKLLNFFICPLCHTKVRYLYSLPFKEPSLYEYGKGSEPNLFLFGCRECARFKYNSQNAL